LGDATGVTDPGYRRPTGVTDPGYRKLEIVVVIST
jgi:hypothetical protein